MNHDTDKKAKVGLKLNVNYQILDKNGNAKKLWANNALGNFLLKTIRKYVRPYDVAGNVKSGLLPKLALYGIQIPVLTGFWVGSLSVSNLITTAGKAGVASRINGSGAEDPFIYIAVGTGTTAANVADTTLETETAASGLSRASATASRVTTDTTNDTAQLLYTFTVTGTVAVTESGVLNAASSGVLLARQTFSAINVVNGDSLQITWKIDVD